MKKIAVVVPTCRPEKRDDFKIAWRAQFEKHDVELVVVVDWDEKPVVVFNNRVYEMYEIMGKYSDVIFNHSDCVRNLGFAFVAKFLPEVKYIISLDDDVTPEGDTIGDHLKVLRSRASLSWINTVNEFPVRGLPYNTRDEAPVMLSHGMWVGVPDLSAVDQLKGIPNNYSWYKGSIPKGAYFPLCAMNFAFAREALPYVYQAPMGVQSFDRFADIWSGVTMKRFFDSKGWAVVTGMAVVRHERASNVFSNLIKEAKGLKFNEGFWKDDGIKDPDFEKLYTAKLKKWLDFMIKNI